MGTKTEDYLKILAEGGDAPTSCCMTNTQKLIAEAIDRINNLQPGGGPTVVQTIGTSTADVMSQNAVSRLIYKDPTTKNAINIGGETHYDYIGSIQIGDQADAPEDYCIAIGYNARGSQSNYPYGSISIGADTLNDGECCVIVGMDSKITNASYSVAIGPYIQVLSDNSVAIGSDSYVGMDEEHTVSVGCPAGVYDRSAFTRRIANVTDPTSAQDAATKNYVDTIAGNVATILQTLNSGNGAQ